MPCVKGHQTFIFLQISPPRKNRARDSALGDVQHSGRECIRRYTITSWPSALAATPATTVALQQSVGGTMAHELVGLYVVNGKKKREKSSRTAALFSLRDAGWRCLSSSRHIHMVGLYSAVHPITRRAPVGIQFRYNHDDRTNRTPLTLSLPVLFIIIVILGGHIQAAVGPQTFAKCAFRFPRGVRGAVGVGVRGGR